MSADRISLKRWRPTTEAGIRAMETVCAAIPKVEETMALDEQVELL